MDSQKQAIAEAIELAGGAADVARRRGFKATETVLKWARDGEMPAEHVIWLSGETGWEVTPHQLSRQFYPHADDGLPPERRRTPIQASANAAFPAKA